MQRQNINLFKQFKKPRIDLIYLSWKNFLVSTIALICICFGIYFLYLGNFAYRIIELRWKKSSLDKLQVQYAEIKSKYPAFFFTENVQDVVSQLQKNVGMQTDLLHTLANPYSFSENLLTLSRTIVPNVWLVDINIQDGGNKTTLKGMAISMQELQQFISNLTTSPIYNGSRLTIDNIASPPDNKNNISFTISMVMAR